MKKQTILSILASQKKLTKKTTRQDVIDVVSKLVDYHIKDNAEINGLSTTRSNSGLNLGELVEIVIKSKFRNKLDKDNKQYDATIKGDKVEIKWSTSDAYAHTTNTNNKVDYYLIGRAITNQKAKYLDRNLTREIFGVVGL